MKNRFILYSGWLVALLMCVVVARLRLQGERFSKRGDASLVVRSYVNAIRKKNYQEATKLCSQKWLDGWQLCSGGAGNKIRFIDLLPAETASFVNANARVGMIEYIGEALAEVEIRGDEGVLYQVNVEMNDTTGSWAISEFVIPPARNCRSGPNATNPAGGNASRHEQ